MKKIREVWYFSCRGYAKELLENSILTIRSRAKFSKDTSQKTLPITHIKQRECTAFTMHCSPYILVLPQYFPPKLWERLVITNELSEQQRYAGKCSRQKKQQVQCPQRMAKINLICYFGKSEIWECLTLIDPNVAFPKSWQICLWI